jgi:hypothetical protein
MEDWMSRKSVEELLLPLVYTNDFTVLPSSSHTSSPPPPFSNVGLLSSPVP